MFISLWKQTHCGCFIISDLQITTSKLKTGFPFLKGTETIAFKPQLTGFLPFKKNGILKDDMQIKSCNTS